MNLDGISELEAYREMLLIRRFEEKAGQLYGMGFIGGFCHLYIGQEAVVVGMQMALKDGDQVITGYRDHGHMLATGMEARGVMAELTGRQGGYSAARAARCTCSPARRTSTAATASSARRCRSEPVWLRQQVSRQRQCLRHLFRRWRGQPGPGLRELQHGGKLWKLPVIYVIENNRYAMGTSVELARRPSRTSRSAATPSAFPGEQVDGMDVRAVTPPPSKPSPIAAPARGRSFSKC
jgi:pyruvate dehydrogenase E1 component alpha subunit